METVFTFDWDNVYSIVKKGLEDGSITIRDSVAYWSKGSGKSGIVQHMPLKKMLYDPKKLNDISKLIQSTHTTQMAAIGLSTTIIVGAIVVQTMYLAKKIDKLQEKMDLISSDINAQNVMFYMEKMSKYFGAIESARVILLDKSLVPETQDIAANLISQLSIERNEVLSLIDNLISFADQLTDRHLEKMLDFITLILDMMPKAIYIEIQLCDRYGKFKLAEHLMRENTKRYNGTLQHYKDWCNSKAKAAIKGENTQIALPFHEKKDELKALFNCEYNQLLLKELTSPNLKDMVKEEKQTLSSHYA
ncbi:hypothetical protein [Aliivibrio finisterrensis]|uniref:Uncharacterized protein n=1 Tax=Aliivibrio finisterrensis TaxID=511998 RepID=A0A4Q5KQ53_9GAMM|nr:hypothetical protein [Aliivibrio finisterrensis]RYU47761.1 hypothetical protein ERW57_18285 [Aliivibrio finisterrensis]RYU48358.1 hypothetical protein ERW56_18555 [Aliivibrio finisterrensis]RYU53535.1 hypothetical protein ERW50_18550 [Aliivibrio finisterrensis]RYU78996.1 hypothetical protein ERW55_18545 [Aliivibrio finisterrensis]